MLLCWVAQLCPTVCNPMDCSPPGSSTHSDSPGKNIWVGCHALLQGIFPTQGLNPGLLHCRWILYRLSHQGSPRIWEWVAYPFSRGTSWPRNRTGVSCIAGRFLTSWATWEAHKTSYLMVKMWKPSLWNQEWNKEACSNHFYTTLFQMFLIRQKMRNKNKSIKIGKEEIKLIFTDNMIVHLKQLKLITEFKKLSLYKIIIQKSIVFLYISKHLNN